MLKKYSYDAPRIFIYRSYLKKGRAKVFLERATIAFGKALSKNKMLMQADLSQKPIF